MSINASFPPLILGEEFSLFVFWVGGGGVGLCCKNCFDLTTSNCLEESEVEQYNISNNFEPFENV